jgi:nitroimidazol reductase NimA-like FMN-containing flavoprotein (pyridoxamine 5'-phosphate oxidase superfamily)
MFLDPNGLEVLDPAQCRELVGRNEVGRLGFVDGEGVTVLPVVYAVIDDQVLIRTASGSKMASVVARRPGALEVDNIDERRHTGWSVLVRGEMDLVTDEDEIAAIDATGLHSWGQTGSHFLRLPLTEVTGRRMPGGPRNAMR